MVGQGGEQMIEETDSGGHCGAAAAVQVQLDPHLGLGGLPCHRGPPHHSLLRRVATRRSSSSGDRTVKRRK